MPSTRLLVVDDHSIVRLSVCSILSQEPTFDVICQTANGEDAVIKAHELQPDVILLDISLPGISGIEAARQIGKVSPNSRIIFLSQHDTLHMTNEALKTGGYGYVTKGEAALELLNAVRTVSRGSRFVSSRIVAHGWVAS
jgi:DNA-binding NarL/FixJ family response regulator